MKYLVFVLGCTCAGKTTFLKTIQRQAGELVDVLSIGQKLRAMFPPEFFEGKAAMPKTEPLVRSLFTQGVEEFIESDKQYLFVDGMPRMLGQIDWVEEIIEQNSESLMGCLFIWLHASDEVRESRATARDTDPGSLELSLKRLKGDKELMFDVIHAIGDRGHSIMYVDTTCDDSTLLFNGIFRDVVENLPPF